MTNYKGKEVILDTNILMGTKKASNLIEEFKDAKSLCVTLGTVRELDRLKMAEGKKGFEARSALRMLREYEDVFDVIDTDNSEMPSVDPKTVDGDIITYATFGSMLSKHNPVVVTNDLSMSTISKANGVETVQYNEPSDSFRPGFHIEEIGEQLKDKNITEILDDIKDEIKVNEYFVGLVFEYPKYYYKCTDYGKFERLTKDYCIRSSQLGNYKPKGIDTAQYLAFDMLGQHDISLLTGPAGSGKTLLCLAKQFEMLEKGLIDKITVFVNPEKARGAKTLGFYKGDRNLKLMQESIGGILATKLGGGPEEVMALVEAGKLEVIPVSDIRGYEVNENSSLFITEAQNLTKDLMKLALQRAGEGVKIFIEGDPNTQLDSWMYEGDNNGMLRLIEVFSGSETFGNIALQSIYRSDVAELAEKM